MKDLIYIKRIDFPHGGKSTFSNYISECSDAFLTDIYNPTAGCRILEFEVEKVHFEGKSQSVEIELWDCSGDDKYSNCWPAFSREANGVVIVLDPADSNDNEVHHWIEYFIQRQGVRDEQCLVIQSNKDAREKGVRWKGLGEEMDRMKVLTFDLSSDDGHEMIKNEFHRYVSDLLTSISKKQDEEELFILNG